MSTLVSYVVCVFTVICSFRTEAYVSNIFEVPCGVGCLSSKCYIGSGCINCLPNYCVAIATIGTHSVPFCTPVCGKDETCVTAGPLRVCQKTDHTGILG